MPKTSYGVIPKKHAKRLLEAILAYVNDELENVEVELHHRWQDKESDQPKLVIETKLRVLERLTEKDKYEGKLTTDQIRQALNAHLKAFLKILEDSRAKTQGEENWHFTLTLWSKDKEKNLEQFDLVWEQLRPAKSKQQEANLQETIIKEPPPEKDEGLDWRSICRQSLPLQREMTSNELSSDSGLQRKLDQVYVPLALVERKVIKEKREDGLQPGSKEEEKLISISEDSFFEKILRQGQGKSQGRRIAIIGEPGSGKTTRLQAIADWILKPEQKDLGFPIWIDLAGLENQNICQYLENEWLPKCKGEVKRYDLEPHISQAWLLLDGVDEMTSRVERGHVTQLLTGWVQAARVVVTCRVNVWEADKNAFSGFEVFRNLPFEPEQVESFIRQWFAVD